MTFNKQFVQTVLPDAQILYDVFPADITLSVDTRTLRAGDIFIAFAGNNMDGHECVMQALQKGAAGIIINKARLDVLKSVDKKVLAKKLVIVVDDTLQALWALAAAWRAQFTYPVVGITGSVGKTTTREMVCNILTQAGRSFVSTVGNLNSLIGLPMSILGMRAHHQVAVFEVGISKRGDMIRAVDMLRPTLAAITTVGHSHMEGLGSLLDIAVEKREIFKYFKPESIGIINGDQPALAHVGYVHPVMKFGAKTTNQVQARKIRVNSDHIDFVIKIYKDKYPVRISGSHEGCVFNALAAAGIGHLLNVDHATIVKGVSQSVSVHGRFERLPLAVGAGVLINDCYNASPESLKAALLAVEQIKTDAYKVAVIGDMLELGVDSPFWHRQIGRFLRKTPSIREIVLVGNLVKWAQMLIPLGVKVQLVHRAEEAIGVLKAMTNRELLVLVKGSRDMRLEVIVDALAERPVAFSAAKRADDDALLEPTSPRKRATS